MKVNQKMRREVLDLQSMTGYGRGHGSRDGREMLIELKTVNHRYLDITFRMPKTLLFIEDALRSLLQQSALRRGHIDVFVTYQNNREDAREVTLDTALLSALNHALESQPKLLKTYKRPNMAEAITLCNALQVKEVGEDSQAVEKLGLKTMQKAIDSLLTMRNREGEMLSSDLLTHLGTLLDLHEKMVCRAPSIPTEYHMRLLSRLEEWTVASVDEQRVAQEVAIMADRCAIDEELQRLQSHIVQFEQCVHSEHEIGRKLDFLLQEMNREINTIGSKGSDVMLAQLVVDAKCVVEKLREQVQNAV